MMVRWRLITPNLPTPELKSLDFLQHFNDGRSAKKSKILEVNMWRIQFSIDSLTTTQLILRVGKNAE